MNILLQESADILKEHFGERLDKMVVERAVFGLFFSGVKLSTGHGGLCLLLLRRFLRLYAVQALQRLCLYQVNLAEEV